MNPVARKLVRWWLNNQASAALVLGGKSIARDVYEKMVKLDPNDAIALASVGNLRMEAGDSIGAVSAFVDLVERHPGNADGWFNLGYIYEQRDDVGPAERCLREAVRLDKNLDRAWYGLALVLIRTGRLHEAVDALKINVKLQPMSPYGFYQLGMTQHHLGNAAEARRIVEQLRGFEPKFAATLERDIAATPPSAAGTPPAAGRVLNTSSGSVQLKEALRTGT
jgi:tetratricopeptide (TPR) repeat protein